MIRQDYLLRLIEELRRTLAALVALRREGRWKEMTGTLDAQFQRLLGAGTATVARLSETELLARLMQGEATHLLTQKTDCLIALLKEAGDAAVAQESAEEGRACYLKALHLLLADPGSGQAPKRPDFVPQVDALLTALTEAPLPPRTLTLLMRHHEQAGAFGKAEDSLFALLESDPTHREIIEFGLAFYDRLASQPDAVLAAGNLPRPELEAGAAELRERLASPR